MSSQWARTTPARAIRRPISAATSSARIVNRAGSLLRRIARIGECLPFSAQNCRIATKQEMPSATIAKPRMRDVHPDPRQGVAEQVRVRGRLGVADLVDALVDREDAAAEEDHQRDDEGVEVDLAPVAERVPGIGRPLGPLHPDEQQDWLAVSTTECTPSASIAVEPVSAPPTNFAAAMARLAPAAV